MFVYIVLSILAIVSFVSCILYITQSFPKKQIAEIKSDLEKCGISDKNPSYISNIYKIPREKLGF